MKAPQGWNTGIPEKAGIYDVMTSAGQNFPSIPLKMEHGLLTWPLATVKGSTVQLYWRVPETK